MDCSSTGHRKAIYARFTLSRQQQAQAQRDLLRTPTALAGFTQPETGLPMQVVGGATLGLANLKKAALTVDVARKNCDHTSSPTILPQVHKTTLNKAV